MKAYHFVVAWRVPVVQSPFGERLDHGVRDELVLVMHRGTHGWKVAGQGHALFAHQVYVKNVEPLCATSHEVAVVGLSGGGWRTVWARSDDDVTHPSAPSGEAVAFANGRLEGLAIACSECDRLTTALDYAGKEYRRPASAEQCANALRSIYAKFYRELHPDPQKLNELSGRALAAAQQHGQPAPPSTTVGVEDHAAWIAAVTSELVRLGFSPEAAQLFASAEVAEYERGECDCAEFDPTDMVDLFMGTASHIVKKWEKESAGRMYGHKADQQPAAEDEVVFIDGVGAGRSSVKSCHDGVQWIRVGDRVYWPLSDSDAKRLQSACCGNGSFDGPATPASAAGVEWRYHPCTHILIEGLKRLEGGAAVLAEWDRARAQVDAALAAQHQEARND